ncbi:MAG: hypothetical protein KJ670_10525, partial [Alphaproteobacteria bacterium]|nr:hypothetical protein [Alphaproteobacteria bacterium]
ALDRRDDFNRMLRHRTTPSVCTRTSDVRINLARRPSPGAYKCYVDELEASDVQAFGVTDYFFDSYFVVLDAYPKRLAVTANGADDVLC